MNYDNHLKSKGDTFLYEPENGLERFLGELHVHTFHKVKNIYLHINDLNYLNQSLSIEYMVNDTIYKIWYDMIQLNDSDQTSAFFSEIIKKFNIHTVLFHYLRLDWICINQFLPKNVKHYAVLHDTWIFSESGGMLDDYQRNTKVEDFLKRTTGIIAVSQFMYNCVNLLYPEYQDKVKIIENDISTITHIFKPKELINDKMDVLILGNITIPIKGSEIINSLFESSENHRYHLLGRVNDELRNKPFATIKEYNHHTLINHVSEINPHVILIPSIWAETFGLTALEATYLGYPVVCFNVGDLKRIKERKLGYVINEKTSLALLDVLDAIRDDIKTDGEEYKEICRNIKEYPRNFVLDEKYLNLYSENDLQNSDNLEIYNDIFQEQNTEYLLKQNYKKVDYSVYKKEKQDLENVVITLQNEIQGYLHQIQDYNQLYLNEKARADTLETEYLLLQPNKTRKIIAKIYKKIKKM